MIIEDGKGTGSLAGVNRNNHLTVAAISEMYQAYSSFEKGQLFIWNSSYAATAAQTVFAITNTDAVKALRIHQFVLSSSVAQIWNIKKLTSGTPAGTLVTPINKNFSSGKSASALCYGNAAVNGTLVGLTLFNQMSPIATPICMCSDGALILPVNTSLIITAGITGTIYVTLSAYFNDPSTGN